MNYSIERLLELLDEFWKDSENSKCGWEKDYLSPAQPFDIYEIKNRFYDFMKDHDFITGDDKVKYKAARQKTSGLVDIGVINHNHRLTEVGRKILTLAKGGSYRKDNFLSISDDSLVYLSQLLKYSIAIKGQYVRPFVVLLYLLSRLGSLSYEEFTYLAPLCTNSENIDEIIESITMLRKAGLSVDDIVYSQIIKQDNYRNAYDVWMNNVPSEKIICAIGINRKSRSYDKPYFPLYNALKSLFIDGDKSYASKVLTLTKSIPVGGYWRDLLFDTSSITAIKNAPDAHLKVSDFSSVPDEESLKKVFFRYLHLFKVKSTLRDYFDLNRRYIKLSDVVLFEDGSLKLDIVPKQFFGSAVGELYSLAFTEATNLEVLTSLEQICPAFKYDEAQMLVSLNEALGIELDSIEHAYSEVEKKRYERFIGMINTKFTDDKLIELLDNFKSRNDEEISRYVSDNADIPTIFEYVLGIIWYKVSEYKGRILDYMKLSLDADLLPVTHASGGEADIVYEYSEWKPYYPAHSLLLEATLADSNNQRRMEMEPVSRHLGNHLLRNKNMDSYCVFVATSLNFNVISDFKARKHIPFINSMDSDESIPGMKIIPLETSDLREIILQKKKYRELYRIFDEAYRYSEQFDHPLKWYRHKVSITAANNN